MFLKSVLNGVARSFHWTKKFLTWLIYLSIRCLFYSLLADLSFTRHHTCINSAPHYYSTPFYFFFSVFSFPSSFLPPFLSFSLPFFLSFLLSLLFPVYSMWDAISSKSERVMALWCTVPFQMHFGSFLKITATQLNSWELIVTGTNFYFDIFKYV